MSTVSGFGAFTASGSFDPFSTHSGGTEQPFGFSGIPEKGNSPAAQGIPWNGHTQRQPAFQAREFNPYEGVLDHCQPNMANFAPPVNSLDGFARLPQQAHQQCEEQFRQRPQGFATGLSNDSLALEALSQAEQGLQSQPQFLQSRQELCGGTAEQERYVQRQFVQHPEGNAPVAHDGFSRPLLHNVQSVAKHDAASLLPSVHVPQCECNEPAQQFKVKKEGPNTGRSFFKCAKPQGETCRFFQWADEPLRPSVPGVGGAGGAGGSEESAPGPPCHCGQATRQFTVRKDGPNTGRTFFKCSNSDSGCGYFQWTDEAPAEVGPGCYCNQPSKKLVVRKEGANQGRPFYGCAKRPGCQFFQWADEDAGVQGGRPPTATPACSSGGKFGPGGSGGATGECFKCGGTGHWSRDCPEGGGGGPYGAGASRGRAKGRGRGRGRDRGGDGADFSGFEPY